MKRFLNSLQGRLLLGLMLLGIIPFLIVGYILYNIQAQAIRSQVTDELARLATGAADELFIFVDNAEQDARAIAALPAIKSMDIEQQVPVLQALRTEFTRYAQFGIAAPDPKTGRLLLTIPSIDVDSIAKVPSYQSAATGVQDAIIFPALNSDKLILHIHTPITNTQNEVVGVLGSPIPLPNLQEILKKRCINGGNALLIDTSGAVVVQAKPDPLPADLDYGELVRNAFQTPSTLSTIRYNIDKTAHLAAVSAVPIYGWTVIVERPEPEILAPLQRTLGIGAVGMVSSLLLILAAVVWLLRTVLRPLRALVSASQALAAGDSTVELPLPVNDQSEVSTLVQSFDLMRHAVTERESAIRRQLSALEAASDGMAIMNPEMRYTYANHAYMAMLGCQNEGEIVGVACRAFQPAEQVRDRMPEIMQTVKEKGVWRGELFGLDKAGKLFEQEASLTLLESGDFVCVARDISQRKEVERAMQQSQRLESLGLLAGGIAHDFNNMLTAISSSAGLVKHKLDEDSSAHKHVDVILKSTARAANLTRQLLAYAGKEHTESEEIDPLQLVRDNLTLIGPLVPINASVQVNFPLSLPSLTADQSQIQQVVMNLLLNAVEALEGGKGEVRVRAYVKHLAAEDQENFINGTRLAVGNYVCIEVADSGAGMSPETISRIFDPFYTTKSYGRGLGLSATLGILKTHHGAIQVESEPGHGSTFTVYLPANEHELPIPMLQPPVPLTTTGTDVQTILVVDDEENIRHAVRDILNFSGFSVVTARNGADGLRVFQEHRSEISLVMVDVQMPVMTGVEMVQQLHKMDAKTPVIFCSGYNEADSLNGSGPNVGYLQKPFHLDTLVSNIRQMLQQT